MDSSKSLLLRSSDIWKFRNLGPSFVDAVALDAAYTSVPLNGGVLRLASPVPRIAGDLAHGIVERVHRCNEVDIVHDLCSVCYR